MNSVNIFQDLVRMKLVSSSGHFIFIENISVHSNEQADDIYIWWYFHSSNQFKHPQTKHAVTWMRFALVPKFQLQFNGQTGTEHRKDSFHSIFIFLYDSIHLKRNHPCHYLLKQNEKSVLVLILFFAIFPYTAWTISLL